MFAKVLVLASVLAANPAATWRSDGGATIVASYVRIDDEKVYLRRDDNGIVVGVPFERLDRDSLVMALRMAAAAPKVAGKGEPAGKATPAVAKGAPMTVDEVVEFLKARKISGTTLALKKHMDEAPKEFTAIAKNRITTVRVTVGDVRQEGRNEYRAVVRPRLQTAGTESDWKDILIPKELAEKLKPGDVLAVTGTPTLTSIWNVHGAVSDNARCMRVSKILGPQAFPDVPAPPGDESFGFVLYLMNFKLEIAPSDVAK